MKPIQVTIRLDGATVATIDEAARAEERAAKRVSTMADARISRARMMGHLIRIGLEAWRVETERLATQAKVLG